MGEEQYAWKPIQRAGAPEITVPKAGQRHVIVRLDRTPPDRWAEGFVHPPTVSSPTGMGADPELFALTVSFDCVDEAFDDYMQNIDERIAYGNQLYEQQLLPALERAERERKIAEDSRVAAQREADEDAKKWDAGGETPLAAGVGRPALGPEKPADPPVA
jgi:hypothetical protein